MIDAYSNVPEWGSKFLKDRDHVRYLYYMNWVLHVCVSECVCVRPVTQSCPILCDPINCSLPGSSIRGILLARILEWVAISFSRGSSWPRDQTHISCIPCIGRQILYHQHYLAFITERVSSCHCLPLDKRKSQVELFMNILPWLRLAVVTKHVFFFTLRVRKILGWPRSTP